MERTYTIPLRSECLKVPIFLRARKSIKAIRNFTKKHMKVEDVKIGKYLNLKIWERGSRHPPSKVQVLIEIISEKKGNKELKFARVELVGAPKEEKKADEKKGLAARLKDKVIGTDAKAESKEAQIKEEEKRMEKEGEKLMENAKTPQLREHDLAKKSEAKSIHEKQFTRDHREQRQPKPQAQIVR